MNHLTAVLRVLDDALQLQGRSTSFNPETPLMGSVPELDSMAVLAVITGLEAHFGIAFRDDQLSGASFASVGSLCDLVAETLADSAA
jgi:acyl carrier protein